MLELSPPALVWRNVRLHQVSAPQPLPITGALTACAFVWAVWTHFVGQCARVGARSRVWPVDAQSYVQKVEVVNPHGAAVDFSVRLGSPGRYTVSPRTARVQPGERVLLTVKLRVDRFPNVARGQRGQRDHIFLTSPVFEQRLDSTFYLRPRDGGKSGPQGAPAPAAAPETARRGAAGATGAVEPSPSPVPEGGEGGTHAAATVPGAGSSGEAGDEGSAVESEGQPLRDDLQAAEQRVRDLEVEVAALREDNARHVQMRELLSAQAPDVQAVVDAAVQHERESFNARSAKVLHILRIKDNEIERLQGELEQAQATAADVQERLEQRFAPPLSPPPPSPLL